MQMKWKAATEKQVEDAILYYLYYQQGIFAFKVDTQARYDPQIENYRKLNKWIKRGTPDIIGCINIKGFPIFICFECKDEIGKQSPYQKDFELDLKTKTCGFYFVVRSVKDVEIAISATRRSIELMVSEMARNG